MFLYSFYSISMRKIVTLAYITCFCCSFFPQHRALYFTLFDVLSPLWRFNVYKYRFNIQKENKTLFMKNQNIENKWGIRIKCGHIYSPDLYRFFPTLGISLLLHTYYLSK